MSLILRFADGPARQSFLEQLSTELPDVPLRVRASKSNETHLTVTTDEPESEARVRALAESRARVFEDIRFEPMKQ